MRRDRGKLGGVVLRDRAAEGDAGMEVDASQQGLEHLSEWWDERIRRAVEGTPGDWFDRTFDELEATTPRSALTPTP